jgi:FkbM family methyltransferase
MLISFNELVSKYGKPKGVIHIGAHLMEERADYQFHGLYNTVWVEANPRIFERIQYVNRSSAGEKVYNYAISNIDNHLYEFHITNNGESSSILELDKHREHHPHIHVSETITVPSKRMDTLIKENAIDMRNYDFLNLDIQGAELMALQGFGEQLAQLKYIYTEVNINHLYKDCALMSDIDDYLVNYGFSRVETHMTQFEWGDALYVKD